MHAPILIKYNTSYLITNLPNQIKDYLEKRQILKLQRALNKL